MTTNYSYEFLTDPKRDLELAQLQRGNAAARLKLARLSGEDTDEPIREVVAAMNRVTELEAEVTRRAEAANAPAPAPRPQTPAPAQDWQPRPTATNEDVLLNALTAPKPTPAPAAERTAVDNMSRADAIYQAITGRERPEPRVHQPDSAGEALLSFARGERS